MKKILAIAAIVLAFIWLVRPDFSFLHKKDQTPAFTRADVPTYAETRTVEDVAIVEKEAERWANECEFLSENFTRNVVLVFEEDGGWNVRVLLNIYVDAKGNRFYLVEREEKEVVSSRSGDYGEVQTYRVDIRRGDIISQAAKCFTIITTDGAVAIPFDEWNRL